MKNKAVFRIIVKVYGKEPRNHIELTNDVSKPISDAIEESVKNKV